MRREELTRKKIWKYFWKQKFKEVGKFLLVLFIILSVAGFVFQLGWINKCHWVGEGVCIEEVYETALPIWMMISGLITTGMWIIIGLVIWIKDNWEYAKERVEEEVR